MNSGELGALYGAGVLAELEVVLESMKESVGGRPGVLEPTSHALRSESAT